jgi:hypothetical protein
MRACARYCGDSSPGGAVESPAKPAKDLRAPERRIAWLTLALGFAAAAIASLAISARAGAGVLVGALLAWVNLRWLRQALDAIVMAATARSGAAPARPSPWIFVKLFGRYVLIGLTAYVIVNFFSVPAISIVSGLLALGAAAMAESLYEIFTYNH